MYGQATLRLSGATGMDWMSRIAHVDAWIAPTAWVAVAAGMVALSLRTPER